tara:strand:- start:9 stop:1616 length:1608 start_codon:yes stop_codon:yes gene_type:complete
MTQRIDEDIRFYLPADPYYYQVDNLPLEDLLANDIRLQAQIDDILSSERGNTVGRDGFTELQPFIDAGLPGTIAVRPGNFTGRVQRSSGNGIGVAGQKRGNQGIFEIGTPPTTFGDGTGDGNYSVNNSPATATTAGDYVGRMSLFNFKGGEIAIDTFDTEGFDYQGNSVPPNGGRIDLIGITTMNGAMDDPFLPGNPGGTGMPVGDGLPKLAVVKGAGITYNNPTQRQVVFGEKYITVGATQDALNDYGRNLEGDVVPNPEFGTVPSPDDVVNVNFARNLMANGEIAQTLTELAFSNKNGNFFLPIAYVYVPQTHVAGNPIPRQYLKDIRPFFRTAELTLPERQAIVGSVSPSIDNPFVTESHNKAILDHQIDWDGTDSIQAQVHANENRLPFFVSKDFQMRVAPTHVTSGKTFSWQFMIVNGMWIGHARAVNGNYGGTYAFNLYKWGLDNQGGVNSAIATGGFYGLGDIEEGHFGYSIGSTWSSNRSYSVFTESGGLTFRWNYRSIQGEGDNVRVSCTVYGKARDNFNLNTGSW